MAIKIEMLRVFRAVADRGNLAEAAAELGRTPSAVSMMLKGFEDHLGAPLFEGGRKGRLTRMGEQVLAEARRELDHFDRAVGAIEGLARADSGVVRLAAPPSIAATFLPPILAQFIKARPDVRLVLRDMSSSEVVTALDAGEIDFGIAAAPAPSGFIARRLASDPFGVVCPTNSALAQSRQTATFADLAGEALIVNGLCALIDDPAFRDLVARSRLEGPNTASLLGMVRAGIGITVLPRLAYLVAPQALSFLPLGPERVNRDLSLLLPEGRGLVPVAAVLADQIACADFNDTEFF